MTGQRDQEHRVRGTNWVGDAVMTVPALSTVAPGVSKRHLTLATRSWAKGLFADADYIDDLLVHESNGLRSVVQQVRAWRKCNFDLAVIFPNSLETALVASLARVPVRIGYATEGRQRLLTHPLPLPEWRPLETRSFLLLKTDRRTRMCWLNTNRRFLKLKPEPVRSE